MCTMKEQLVECVHARACVWYCTAFNECTCPFGTSIYSCALSGARVCACVCVSLLCALIYVKWMFMRVNRWCLNMVKYDLPPDNKVVRCCLQHTHYTAGQHRQQLLYVIWRVELKCLWSCKLCVLLSPHFLLYRGKTEIYFVIIN